jgi:hypothetical protein
MSLANVPHDVGEALRFAMGDDDERRIRQLGSQQRHQLALRVEIERAGGLVEEHPIRPCGEHSCGRSAIASFIASPFDVDLFSFKGL